MITNAVEQGANYATARGETSAARNWRCRPDSAEAAPASRRGAVGARSATDSAAAAESAEALGATRASKALPPADRDR
jgi:hypothetical protein